MVILCIENESYKFKTTSTSHFNKDIHTRKQGIVILIFIVSIFIISYGRLHLMRGYWNLCNIPFLQFCLGLSKQDRTIDRQKSCYYFKNIYRTCKQVYQFFTDFCFNFGFNFKLSIGQRNKFNLLTGGHVTPLEYKKRKRNFPNLFNTKL